jgi:hypothetical protein
MNKKILLLFLVLLCVYFVSAEFLSQQVRLDITSVTFPTWTSATNKNPSKEVEISGSCYFQIIEGTSTIIREESLKLEKGNVETLHFTRNPDKTYKSRIRCLGSSFPANKVNDKYCHKLSGRYWYLSVEDTNDHDLNCPDPGGYTNEHYGYAPQGGDRYIYFDFGPI